MAQSIKLQTSCILHVAFDKYEKDFTFNVNGSEYQTSKFVADILSTKIAQNRNIDPTINYISINTHSKGNFERFLQLQNFNDEICFSESEIEFIIELIEILGTENIELNITREENNVENALNHLLEDEKHPLFYKTEFVKDIEFVSKNFSEILSKQHDLFYKLSLSALESIINNENFQLENDEDELLHFINELYLTNHAYSILYSFVCFSNVEVNNIEEFLNIFDFNDLNLGTWKSISNRLKEKIINSNKKKQTKNKPLIDIEYSNIDFKGIINYFRTKSVLENEVKITCSSVQQHNIQKVLQTEFVQQNYFSTKNEPNSWICIEFKNHRIKPTSYTIRSNNWPSDNWHLRNWVVEGSNDSNEWEIIDEQKENSDLRGRNLVHTYHVHNKNDNSFKFIRIRQTGQNWYNNYYFGLNCIEFYGQIF